MAQEGRFHEGALDSQGLRGNAGVFRAELGARLGRSGQQPQGALSEGGAFRTQDEVGGLN